VPLRLRILSTDIVFSPSCGLAGSLIDLYGSANSITGEDNIAGQRNRRREQCLRYLSEALSINVLRSILAFSGLQIM
jgi:hypothetical protein